MTYVQSVEADYTSLEHAHIQGYITLETVNQAVKKICLKHQHLNAA